MKKKRLYSRFISLVSDIVCVMPAVVCGEAKKEIVDLSNVVFTRLSSC
jgi:hypothetical protein